MRKTIGVYEAKNNFTGILRDVVNGGSYHVTKHGKPIAVIMPVQKEDQDITEAIEALNHLSKRVSLRELDLKQLIEEGRR